MFIFTLAEVSKVVFFVNRKRYSPVDKENYLG